MQTTAQPSRENDYLGAHAELILSSLARLTGRQLVDPALHGVDRYRALYQAPFCVVSHNTDPDPVFNYANKVAQELFAMTWPQFTRLPSRFSAEPQVREERERLLSRVSEFGYVDDYHGVRVAASGRRFYVEDAVVWNLIDAHGRHCGQAAALFRWSDL